MFGGFGFGMGSNPMELGKHSAQLSAQNQTPGTNKVEIGANNMAAGSMGMGKGMINMAMGNFE